MIYMAVPFGMALHGIQTLNQNYLHTNNTEVLEKETIKLHSRFFNCHNFTKLNRA